MHAMSELAYTVRESMLPHVRDEKITMLGYLLESLLIEVVSNEPSCTAKHKETVEYTNVDILCHLLHRSIIIHEYVIA